MREKTETKKIPSEWTVKDVVPAPTTATTCGDRRLTHSYTKHLGEERQFLNVEALRKAALLAGIAFLLEGPAWRSRREGLSETHPVVERIDGNS